VRTLTDVTRLGESVDDPADWRGRQSTLLAGNQWLSPVIVGHRVTVVLDVVLDDLTVLLGNADRPLGSVLVLERRIPIWPVFHIDTPVIGVGVLHVHRLQRSESNASVPEQRENDVLAAGVVESFQVLQDLLGAVGV
jgi:hypothetical protein